MEEVALQYLKQDYITNMDMIVAIKDGATILKASSEGVLLYTKEKVGMIDCINYALGKQWLQEIDEATLFSTHQEEYIPEIEKLFALKRDMTVFHCVYEQNTVIVKDVAGIKIRKMDTSYVGRITEHYSMNLDETYILRCVSANPFFGAFKGTTLVGFIGMHEEKTIGFVEVLPEYQGRGIGKYLMTYYIHYLLSTKQVIYSQVKINNKASLLLHEKLNFTIGNQEIYWVT